MIFLLCILSKVKCKGIPITYNEGPWENVDVKVHIFAAMAVGRDKVASPTLDRLYPRECPGIHFIGG